MNRFQGMKTSLCGCLKYLRGNWKKSEPKEQGEEEINDLNNNAALCIHCHTRALSTFRILCLLHDPSWNCPWGGFVFLHPIPPSTSFLLRFSQIFSHLLVTIKSLLLNLLSHQLFSVSPCFLYVTCRLSTNSFLFYSVLYPFLQMSTQEGVLIWTCTVTNTPILNCGKPIRK